MKMVTLTTEFSVSYTPASSNSSNGNSKAQSIIIIQSTIACVGIVANLTVIFVFLNHKQLRRKIPNIFIINQVRKATYNYKRTYLVLEVCPLGKKETIMIFRFLIRI